MIFVLINTLSLCCQVRRAAYQIAEEIRGSLFL